MERRAIEFSMRPRAAESLQQTAHNFASQASSSDPKYSHIPAADKKKVIQANIAASHCLLVTSNPAFILFTASFPDGNAVGTAFYCN